MFKRAKSLAFCAAGFALAAASAASGGNLLFNSSFELGDKGYAGLRSCVLDADWNFKNSGPVCVVDSSTAKEGVNSVRLDNPNGDVVARFETHDIDVSDGQELFVSFWAKAATPGVSLTVAASSFQTEGSKLPSGGFAPDSSYEAGKHAVTVRRGSPAFKFACSTEWTRFSFKFKPPQGRSACSLWFCLDNVKGQVWLDCLQVEKGALTAYAPAAPVEAAVFMKPLFADAKEVDGKLLAVSYSSSQKAFPLELSLKDGYRGDILSSQAFKLDLPEGKAVEREFSFKLDRKGLFRVFTSLQPDITPASFRESLVRSECPNETKRVAGDLSYESEAQFVSVFEPKSFKNGFLSKLAGGKTFNLDGFMVGYCGPFDGVKKVWTGNDIYEYRYGDGAGSLEELAETARLSGARVFRLWDRPLFPWRDIEPENGVFKWDRADRVVDAMLKAGVAPYPTLGPAFNPDQLPKWVRQRDRLGHFEGTAFPEMKVGFMDHVPATNLPQIEDWKGYVGAIAKRYKGRIPCYGVLNEPYFTLTPKLYSEYLKAAYEAIKAEDPDALVVGFSATGDRGANLKGFLRGCLEEGAGKYCDAAALHPYDCDNSSPSAMDVLRMSRKALDEFGVKAPLWNEESYYLNGDWSVWDPYRMTCMWPADTVTRRCALDMGEGLKASHPFFETSLYQMPCEPGQYLDMWQNLRQIPNAKYAALSAAGRFLNGAKPLKTVEFPGGVVSYVFENDGRLLTVVWKIRGSAGMAVELPAGASARVFDFFGNERELVKAGKLDLPLSHEPFFIEWLGCDAKGAIKAMETASVRGETDFSIAAAKILSFGQERKLALSLRNTSGGTLENARGEVSAPGQAPLTLEFGKMANLDDSTAMAALPSSASFEKGATLSVSGSPRPFSAAFEARPTQVVDVLNFQASPEVKIGKLVVGKIDSPEDLSASFSLSYEDGALIVKVFAKDDKKGEIVANNPFDEDAVEIFIDKEPFKIEGDPKSYGKSAFQLVYPVWRKKDGEISEIGKVDGIVTAFTESRPGGYVATVKIPLRCVKPETLIGFDIGVDDSDSRVRKSQSVWHGSKDDFKDRSGFGIIRLLTPKARLDAVPRDASGKSLAPLRSNVEEPLTSSWKKLSFSVVPPKDAASLDLLLLSGWTPDKNDRYWVHYRNLKVDGAALSNPSLEKLAANGNPEGWAFVRGASFVKKAGEPGFFKATHDSSCVTNLKVEGGKPVVVECEACVASPVESAKP